MKGARRLETGGYAQHEVVAKARGCSAAPGGGRIRKSLGDAEAATSQKGARRRSVTETGKTRGDAASSGILRVRGVSGDGDQKALEAVEAQRLSASESRGALGSARGNQTKPEGVRRKRRKPRAEVARSGGQKMWRSVGSKSCAKPEGAGARVGSEIRRVARGRLAGQIQRGKNK
uniref:Uncharacterized protein n=1 Tax=Phyllostachys edulis TaxID=38705 RepID=D3IVP9_PHYED|nr:hypothetical protein [Phyllostachys edulis]